MPNHRKPRAIKLIQGTHRKSRDPANPWTPPPGLPDPPTWLSEAGQAEWHRVGPQLDKQGVIAETDFVVFASYCSAVGSLHDAETILAEDRKRAPKAKGLTKKTQRGHTIQNPAYTIAQGARPEAIRYAQLLGLTPVDRDKVSRIHSDKPDDPAARFFD